MRNYLIISLLFLSVGFCQQIIHTTAYENGNIKSITYYNKTRNGLEKVKYEQYYKNGQKMEEITFKEDKQVGKWTFYDKDGTIKKVKEH